MYVRLIDIRPELTTLQDNLPLVQAETVWLALQFHETRCRAQQGLVANPKLSR